MPRCQVNPHHDQGNSRRQKLTCHHKKSLSDEKLIHKATGKNGSRFHQHLQLFARQHFCGIYEEK